MIEKNQALRSLAPLSMLDVPPRQFVQAAAHAGFNAVGLRLIPPTVQDPPVSLVDDRLAQRELLACARGLGISLFDVEALWIEGHTMVAHHEKAFAVAAALGAQQVLVAGNDPEFGRQLDTFGRLCEMAAGFGLGVALEFMPYCQVATLEDALRVIRAAAQPNAGLLIDALHLYRSGGRSEDVAAVGPNHIAYAQLCDAASSHPPPLERLREEAKSNRRHPGRGQVQLARPLLDVLPPEIPLSVEAPDSRFVHLPPSERARLCAALFSSA